MLQGCFGTHIKSYYSSGDIYTQRAQYTSLLFFYGPQFYIPVEGAAKLSMCHNEALFLVLHCLPTNVALLLWRVSKKLESVPRNDLDMFLCGCRVQTQSLLSHRGKLQYSSSESAEGTHISYSYGLCGQWEFLNFWHF